MAERKQIKIFYSIWEIGYINTPNLAGGFDLEDKLMKTDFPEFSTPEAAEAYLNKRQIFDREFVLLPKLKTLITKVNPTKRKWPKREPAKDATNQNLG